VRALLVAAALAAGCNPTPEQACADRAKATCALIERCQLHGVDRFGDLGSCVARLSAVCASELAAPGARATTSTVEGCSLALSTAACAAFRAGDPAPACRPPSGALGDGAPCAFDSQCASAFCRVSRSARCGACAEPLAAGDLCDGACPVGLTCADDGSCRAFAAAGALCDASHPCPPGLGCTGSPTTFLPACQPLGAQAGAACDASSATLPDCDPAAGLFCDGAPGQCRAVAAAAVGATCGAGAACGPGASCFGACVADAVDGASCSASGPGCLAPAVCTGSCQLPDATACR
jgi:hypothetical protein